MMGRHTYAPMIYPGDEALNAQDDAARIGRTCFGHVEDLGALLDKYPHEWSADDLRMLARLNELLVEAGEIARRLSP